MTAMHRTANNEESHGYLLEIDWGKKRILKKIEAPPLWSHFNWRNRGGRRGLRGITFYNGLIWVASCEMVFGLDPDTLELERMVSHPYLAHIHEIKGGEEGIWITSTGGEGVILINEHEQVLHEAWLCGKPVEDLRVKLDFQQKYHVNSVFFHDSKVYMYATKTGEVFRIRPFPIEVEVKLESGCHNVRQTLYGWARNHSQSSFFKIGEKKLLLPRRGPEGEFTSPGWLRGMDWIDPHRVLIGSTPAALYEIDAAKMEIVGEMKIEKDVSWTVSGLYVDLPHRRQAG
jgi:hypothetical protein